MNTLTALFTATLITLTAGIAQARDLGPDEALRLRDAGTIVSFEKLNATALAKHPGSKITETELEEEYGKYIYQVEMRDPQGCLLYTSPSPRDRTRSRMPSSA